jgi:lysophospholipase L1-like esterase
VKRLVGLLAALSAVLAACTNSAGSGTSTTAPEPVVYTAVGASESVGVGADDPATEAWPRVLARTALPPDAVFHDVAVSDATAADALRTQVPAALATHPNVVTVWLNVNDLIALVTAANYEKTLKQIVHALRRDGAAQVLVANTPPVENLPAFNRRFGFLRQLAVTRVDEYNASISRVVKAEGAILVDLHSAGVRARDDGTLPSLIARDGFHPSTAGHVAIAASFAAELPARFRVASVS